MQRLFTTILLFFVASTAAAEADYVRALRRAQYLLNGTTPTDDEFTAFAASKDSYQAGVRQFLDSSNFYDVVLRYHERVLGVGLPMEYLEELLRDDIDNKQNKFASISCEKTTGTNSRFRCYWSSNAEKGRAAGGCPPAWEEAASVFWYPGVIAWACPSVIETCGTDLSRCFITFNDEDVAKNSELGTTEIFDSRFAVIKSLSRQPAGLATAIVVENYPYTYLLEPGLTAVDGAIAHFYRQQHHFKIGQLNIPAEVLEGVQRMDLTDTRYRLIKTGGDNYASGGLLSTFGWLRRYDKNRTRANQLYERLLCRKFTSELPKVFPQDPGNLREAPGCNGCHATLDPLADFFKAWGEEGSLYAGHSDPVDSYFAGQHGSTLADLADIVRYDEAFATCTVQHVWEWLMGRKFYTDEDTLRAGLTDYFVNTKYSFKELVYAVTTHPAFIEGTRGDAVVTDPLEEPPLGQVPGEVEQECTATIDYNTHIAPNVSLCTPCHNASNPPRIDLSSEAQWQSWGSQSVGMMASGQMPPGQSGPQIQEFKESVRCWLEQNE